MEWKHETNEIGSQMWRTSIGNGINIGIYKWSDKGKYDWNVGLDWQQYPELDGPSRNIAQGYADTLEEAKAQAEAAAAARPLYDASYGRPEGTL